MDQVQESELYNVLHALNEDYENRRLLYECFNLLITYLHQGHQLRNLHFPNRHVKAALETYILRHDREDHLYRIEIYQILSEINPIYRRKLSEIYRQRGISAKQRINFSLATTYFNNAIKYSSHSIESYYHLGLTHIQQKDWKSAMTSLQKALSLFENSQNKAENFYYEICYPYAIASIHGNEQERATELLQKMKERDKKKEFMKEITFVEMYLHLFGEQRQYKIITRSGSQQNRENIDYFKMNELISNVVEKEIAVLDLRNESYYKFYGPKGNMIVTPIRAKVLFTLITARRPMKGKEIEIILKLSRPFRGLVDEVKRYVLKRCFHDAENLYSGGHVGYEWIYPKHTYVLLPNDFKDADFLRE